MTTIDLSPGAPEPLVTETVALNENPYASPASPPPRASLPTLSQQEESALVAHIRDLFFKARDARRPLINKWLYWHKTLHVLSAGRTTSSSGTEVPEIFPIVDAIVSWVTDQQPQFHCAPAVPPLNPWYKQYSQLASDLETVIRSSWHVDKFDAEIEKCAWDAYTYGIGYLKSVWNGAAYCGYGNAVMRRIDPFTFYPDPRATSPDNLQHAFEVQNISYQELERRFPGAYSKLNLAGYPEDITTQPTQTDLASSGSGILPANLAPLSPNSQPWGATPAQSATQHDADTVGVIEAWLRTPYEVKDKNTDITRSYDSWRCVVVAGNNVLFDAMAEDMWSHGSHPYDRFVAMETGDWYGKSMVELLAPMQVNINRVTKSAVRNMDLMGNPIMVDDNRSGIARTRITNTPGERITKNAGSEVQYLLPPAPAPDMAGDLVRFFIQEMERISGLSAVVRGASPSGRNAQGVIDSMQEAAFVRIRKTVRNLGYAIGSAGEKLAAMIVEFYDQPRLVTSLSTGGQQDAIFLSSHHFYVPDATNNRVPMRYALLCDAGESQAQSRGQRISEADQLYALGAIDARALLEIHDLPGWQVIADRIEAQQQQAGTMGQPPTQRAAARR